MTAWLDSKLKVTFFTLGLFGLTAGKENQQKVKEKHDGQTDVYCSLLYYIILPSNDLVFFCMYMFLTLFLL